MAKPRGVAASGTGGGAGMPRRVFVVPRGIRCDPALSTLQMG
jgi:hypothetical protein